jgi:hypothetical protein
MILKQQSKWQQLIGLFGAIILPIITLGACGVKIMPTAMANFDWLPSEGGPNIIPWKS